MFLDPKKKIEKHRWGLPHWHQDNTLVFVTWRLADSLPTKVVEKLKGQEADWLACHPKPWDQKIASEHNRKFILPLEDYLDDCHGSCCLKEHHQIVADALHHFDKERYDLDCFVVMPNHVHVLFRLKKDHPLADVIHSLKRHTAREINKALSQTGKLWQSKYWDRLIRSEKHLDWTRNYISDNPKNLPKGSFSIWSEGL